MSNSGTRPEWAPAGSAGVSRVVTVFVVVVGLAVVGAAGAVAADAGGTVNATGGATSATNATSAANACGGGGTGTLTINVYGHDGSEVDEGEVILYSASNYERQDSTAFAGGQATFDNADLMKYNVEVYTDDGEFLGASSVCHSGYTSTDHYASSPNLDSVTYEERGGDGDGVIEPGERVLVSPTVVNDDNYGLEVRTVIEYENEKKVRGPRSISGGETQSYGAQFDVDDGGDKDVTIRVEAKYGGGWQLTHKAERTVEIDERPTSEREDPTNDTVDAEVGETVTFEVNAEDDGGLGGVEWYVDGDYEGRNGLSGDDDTDEFTKTFEETGEYTVEADVYDGDGSTYNDDAATWTVNVDEPESDVTVEVTDRHGDDANADVKLFRDWDNLDRRPTGGDGEVTYDDREHGTYQIEVIGTDGYWGTAEFEVDGNTTFEFQRRAPYVVNTTHSDGDGDGQVEAGEEITVATTVKNDAPVDKETTVTVNVDGLGSVDQTKTIPSDSKRTFTATFTPDSGGTYDYTTTVEADYGDTMPTDETGGEFSVAETHSLSTSSGDGGSVSVSPDKGAYADGETVTLTAEPSSGFEFDHWEGDVPDSQRDDREIDLEMDRDRSVKAVFTRGEGAVKVNVEHPDGDPAKEVNAILVRNDGDLVREVKWPDGDLVDVPRTFDGLAAGEQYQFEVYVQDQLADSKTVTVAANETTSVTAETRGQVWIKPKVVDAAGEPLEGVSVTVYSHEYDQDDSDRTEAWRGNLTNERGYVETPLGDGRLWLHRDDDNGYYVVVVTRDGEQIARKKVDGLTDNRELTLETSVPSVNPAVAEGGWTVKEATSDDGKIAVGERTAVGVTLRNDGSGMPLRTVFQFDTDGDGEPDAVDVNGDGEPDYADYDGDGDDEPGTIRGNVEKTDVAAGGTEPFGLRFAPDQAGDWRVRAVMQAHPNDKWVAAGTTDWEGFSVVGTEKSAKIVDSETTMPSGTFGPGEDVTATVTVQNTGTVEETFYVGYTATHRDSDTAYDVAAKEVTLPPGATREVSLTWTVPEIPQTGEFGLVTAVWLDSTDEGLVGRQDDATGAVTVEADDVVTVVSHDPQENTTTTTQFKRTDETYSFEHASLPIDGNSIDNRNLPPTDGVTNITKSGQYPWTAVGQVRGQNSSLHLFSCTGAVIEDNHVLTAAHCVYEEDREKFLINLNFQPARNGHEEPLPSYSVEHVQVYESYSSEKAPVRRDIAVLTLEQPIADETGTFAFDAFTPSSDVYGDGLRLAGYPSREKAGYVNVDSSLWHIGLNGKKFTTIEDCTGTKCLLAGSKIIGEFTAKGNSGGPAWRVIGDEPHIIGVHHGVGGIPQRAIEVRITPGKYSDIGKMVERGNQIALSPVVSLDVPEPVVPGKTVTLDASESFDPDGEIDHYKWSVDKNENDFEKRTDDPRLETELQQNPGSPVRVKAVDEDGQTATMSVYVDFRTEMPETPQFQNRAVYVWGYADDLARNAAARERFLDRADEQNLNTVFLSWGALSTATPEQRATLLRALNESGIQAHAMVGAAGPNAIQTTRDTVPKVLAYNADRPEAEQVDGIHLDAEPGGAELKPFLDDYQTLLSEIETGITGGGETVRSQELAVSSAVGWWWDQSDQAPQRTDELVESPALDYVVVMAYYDEAGEVRNRTAAITDETDTPYVVAVETQEFARDGLSERVSFYEEGPEAATDALEQIASDPPREGHRGGALHFYQSAVATWDSLRGGTTPDTVTQGETATLTAKVVFDDRFPRSNHRSQLVVELRGPNGTETLQKTVTPPGSEVTSVDVNWAVPDDAAPGEYTAVATLRDTTVENGQFEAVGTREDPVTLDTVRLGTVTVEASDDGGDTGDGNQPPAVEIDAPETATVGERVAVDAAATDPDGDNDTVTFDWAVTALDGGDAPTPGDAGVTRLTFDEPGEYEVTVTATDADGASDTATHTITVESDDGGDDGDSNEPPTLSVREPTDLVVGESVTLEATAEDPDARSDTLKFDWRVIDTETGYTEVSASTDDTPRTAWAPEEPHRYRIEVTVTDRDGATATETVFVNVSEPGNGSTPPPQAAPEVDSETVTRGGRVTLDANATDGDADGDLRYEWTQVAGPTAELTDADTATPTVTAPQVSQRQTLRYRVTVTDGDTGATANGTVAVTVTPGDTTTQPQTFEFETAAAVDEWQTGTRGDERATLGEATWSERANGSLRLAVDGAPSTIVVWREVGALAAGTKIRVEYAPERFAFRAAGLHLYVRGGDGNRSRIDIENQATNDQDGTLVGTVPRDLGPEAKLELKLVIWPGETTVFVDNITVGSGGDDGLRGDDAPYTATRRVDGPVTPGETATVTVAVDVNESVDGLALNATPGGGTLSRNGSTPAATFRPEAAQWLWLSAEQGTYTVTYDVRVPDDAERGTTIPLSGTVSASGLPSVTVEGDDAIRVRACSAAVATGDDRAFTLREIQRAVGAWADDEPVGGEVLDLRTIQRFVGAWADDERVTCGGGR